MQMLSKSKRKSLYAQKSKQGLSVELLLVRLHVDATLELRAGSADLETDLPVLHVLVEFNQALDAGVLHRVLQTGGQVRHKLANRTKQRGRKC